MSILENALAGYGEELDRLGNLCWLERRYWLGFWPESDKSYRDRLRPVLLAWLTEGTAIAPALGDVRRSILIEHFPKEEPR